MLRSASTDRPHSPFEALLAVSGNLQSELPLGLAPPTNYHKDTSSPSHFSKQSAYSQDGGTLQLLQDPLAERYNGQANGTGLAGKAAEEIATQIEHRPEGVGTSGGGESGDTDDTSESSKQRQGDGYAEEEGSEIHQAAKGNSWGARSRDAKKQRMVWTPELHKRFLNAVNHLGMKNAVPKTILRMMNVDGMTRENVASHLQKYRLYLKREGDADSQMSPDPAVSAQQTASPSLPSSNTATAGLAQGVPVCQAFMIHPGPTSAFDAPALGLPVGTSFIPFQLQGSTLQPPSSVGSSHIPPQAWAAGVPGYDAVHGLHAISCQQSAALLMGLQTPFSFPMPQSTMGQLPSNSTSEDLAAKEGSNPMLDIAPLTTLPPSSAEQWP